MAGKKSSRLVLRDDMIFTGYSSNGYSIPIDARPGVGGHDAGVSPVELVLTALGGCTVMDVLSILRKKQEQVTGMEVFVEGERADEHPQVYTSITVRYVVTGRNIKPASVERAIELSRDKYCSVSAMLHPTVPISYTYEIVEAGELEPEPAVK
ncbi:MAG TPA: OsmC family protein [Aggregatilinea sp.]|jgi:putative redox protein|uniref:OsmC family protein n=1 Tax=Aggregatilinea sp. TaxID=2806333 RepID=UPI002BFC09D7|nr:OsmC family protein [Aggregatilinea sp.]HML20191.1 OsmC family protein [Aggregatilinea sp.]